MLKTDYEIIVVDDASEDASRKIIDVFGDDIRPIFLKKNGGLANAINIGIQNALGEYIARLDSDDIMRHNFLCITSEFLDYNKKFDWVKVDHFVIDERENTLERSDKDLACCILFRKRAIESVGLYNSNLRVNETLDVLVRLMNDPRYKDCGAHLPIPLYKWFKREDSLTKGGVKGQI
jgi:glycosyltransferase involved in cell wall biosynthesis